MKKQIDANESREKFSGIRIGDTVSIAGRSGIVKKYDVFDNGVVWVAVEGKESLQKFAAGSCSIDCRVDDVVIAPIITDDEPAPADDEKFLPPVTIVMSADDNELTFVEYSNKLFYYKYTRSETKLGLMLPISVEHLKKLIERNPAPITNSGPVSLNILDFI